MTTAVSVSSLSKRYRLGGVREDQYKTIRDSLSRLARFSRRPKAERNEVWALRDVSFEVAEGEALGIIGRNGAGKSTLLKILSRITEPTSGSARLRGRVASLLEVGTGFHPELTGRENIYLNGSILGMSRAEIRRDFDAIVAFAEIEKFLDTPVKRYSSGMYVRLAFAVAAHLTPEILIVDEVLSVGDAEFQRRCLGRMSEVARSGRTVLLVSHNMSSIESICERAIWLDRGQKITEGAVRSVTAQYLSAGSVGTLVWNPPQVDGNLFHYSEVRIETCSAQNDSDCIPANQGFAIVLNYKVEKGLPSGRLSVLLEDIRGQVIFTACHTDNSSALNAPFQPGDWSTRCPIAANWLAPGRYFLTVSEPLADGKNEIHERILSFLISEEGALPARDGRLGVLAPLFDWKTVERAVR